jgi:hypothetical protein
MQKFGTLKMNKVFRFHSPTSIAPDNSARRLKKRKTRVVLDPILVAADTNSITNARGTWPIETYEDFADSPCVTLTRKEADQIAIATPGKRPPLALEELHPWLPLQQYHEDSAKNFQALQVVFNRFGQHLVTAREFCDKKWNTVCNAVRMKTDLDARFYTAWHLPIQDAYILEESRHDRRVIALDFNAMYPFCMQQRFPKPSAMRHVVYDRDVESGEVLPAGLFRCIIQGPFSEFISKHNPFRSFFAGRHLRTSLSDRILVDLNEFEVEFFQRHFRRIHIVDAVISDESIVHPLARDAQRSFARRVHYLGHNNWTCPAFVPPQVLV